MGCSPLPLFLFFPKRHAEAGVWSANSGSLLGPALLMCVFVSVAAVARLSTVQEVSRLRSRVDASRSSCEKPQCADMRFYRGLLCNDAKNKCICAADSTTLDESGGRDAGIAFQNHRKQGRRGRACSPLGGRKKNKKNYILAKYRGV